MTCIVAKVGMNVDVIIEASDPSVRGTIIKVEQLIVEETDEVLSENLPIIKTLDGRIVTGMECWWTPVTKDVQ